MEIKTDKSLVCGASDCDGGMDCWERSVQHMTAKQIAKICGGCLCRTCTKAKCPPTGHS